MDLPVIVDGNHPHNRLRPVVAGEEHGPGPHAAGNSGVRQYRPAKAVIVLGVEVCYEIAIHHLHPPVGDEPVTSTRFTWDGHQRSIDAPVA